RTLNLTNHLTVSSSKILVRAVLEKISSGIESGSFQNSMDFKQSFFPKIVRNELVLTTPGSIKIPLKIKLFDLSGKVLKTGIMGSGTMRINLSGLSSKIILLSVTHKGKIQVFKLLL
ncbi:MAG: hypothetical protein GX556_03120, partial [Fibrobacter sp.]|nr:hypothetical protein [Fibrobacter sp.]